MTEIFYLTYHQKNMQLCETSETAWQVTALGYEWVLFQDLEYTVQQEAKLHNDQVTVAHLEQADLPQ